MFNGVIEVLLSSTYSNTSTKIMTGLQPP